MNPEEKTKQTIGEISVPQNMSHLTLPVQVLCYGSNIVTNHTYRHILAAQNPIPFAIFQYTMDGCGEFIQRGKKSDLPSGSAFLAQSPSPNVCQQHPDYDSYHFVYFQIQGEAAMRIIEQIVKRFGCVLKFSQNSKCISMLCQHINELRANDKPFDVYAESAFAYEFLITLWSEHFSEANLASEQVPESLERAIVYLEKHISNPLLDIADLAKEAKISKCYFTRIFRKFYGTSPRKYLLSRRLDAAMQMLLNNRECLLKDVIEKCGFTTEAYFCYAFRKMYHQTPGALRNREL